MGIYSRYILEADKDEDNFDINIEEDDTSKGNNKENNEEKTEELDLKDDEDMTVDADATEKQAEEDNNQDDETTDENNEETPAEDNEDFTINPDDENTDNSEEDTENTDSDTTNNIEDSEEDDGEDTKSKFDAALYDSLSDSEKANKNAELLSNYKDLYISCDNIIEKINNINKDTENIKVLQRIACTLSDLKYYISFYLDNNYKNKSYYENDIMFNKYLAILNGVKNVLQEFSNKKEEK